MVVFNCIGSNVFDMLCLGILWMIKIIVIVLNSVVYI